MTQRFLDPKNDIVFKRIFGEHPEILRSLLNALLPLPPDGQIVELFYLQPEQVPVLPMFKNSIVDVKCRDAKNRLFIVEMQMNWTSAFMQRMLFNASKAYVRQLVKGEEYDLLQPVVGLSILDDTFDHAGPEFYHHYAVVNVQNPQRVISGLELVFVELPKYLSQQVSPMRRAWLRFLKELGELKSEADAANFHQEVTNQSAELAMAVNLAGESGFSEAELEAYDRYWDGVRTERTLMSGKFTEGLVEGLEKGETIGIQKGEAIGIQKGEAIGIQKGAHDTKAKILANLLAGGFTEEDARKIIDG
jgi:predicted transposase/invertase (TIGR01784 family)